MRVPLMGLQWPVRPVGTKRGGEKELNETQSRREAGGGGGGGVSKGGYS